MKDYQTKIFIRSAIKSAIQMCRAFFISVALKIKKSMIKIGITGGIGSGKSIVSKVFSTLGIPVFDADSWSKKIMNEDEDLIKKITYSFGKVYEDGVLNRKKLGEMVFKDQKKLQTLNALVHPATIKAWKQWEEKQSAPYIIKEAAIMFESGTAADIDYMIGVYAPVHLRIKRTMQRNKISREDVLQRMDKQIDDRVKMKLCDYVVLNDESTLVIPQVIDLHKKLIQLKNN